MLIHKPCKTLLQCRQTIQINANPEKAIILQRFFKTGKGEYAEGDKFLGITVPVMRKIAKDYYHLDLEDISELLTSPIHEERSIALLLLLYQYNKAEEINAKKSIYEFYADNFQHINNWDLVDLSAPNIAGHYLFSNNHGILQQWVKSEHMWTRRIAVMATFYFIRQNKFDPTLQLATILINDKEDLIHKAVGWMLREIGKRDREREEIFLDRYHRHMPRTMLRYAIEKFPESKRQLYLRK